MVRSLPLVALGCVAASLGVVFVPLGLADEGALIVALALIAVGAVVGLVAAVRRQWLGLLAVGLGLVLAVWYVALYGHRN